MTEIEALVLSAAIEAPIAYAIARAAGWPCRGPVHVAAASAVATAVTHPQAWEFALAAYAKLGMWGATLTIEGLVILAEAALIAWMAQLRPDRAALVSLLANSSSWFAGYLIGA